MLTSRRFRPALESLEGRACPAVFVSVVGTVMTVVGDNAANTIAIRDDGAGYLTVTADGQKFEGTGITAVRVRAQAGDDAVSYALTAPLTGLRSVDLDLEKGNDAALIDLRPGVAGGALNFQAQGNDGTDTLMASVGTITIGSFASVQVNGGNDADRIDVTFAGTLAGSLGLKGSGQDGNDTVVQNVTLAANSSGKLDASVRGGKGDDHLTLKVSPNAAALAFASLTLDGDDGIDTWVATANVRVRNAEIAG